MCLYGEMENYFVITRNALLVIQQLRCFSGHLSQPQRSLIPIEMRTNQIEGAPQCNCMDTFLIEQLPTGVIKGGGF